MNTKLTKTGWSLFRPMIMQPNLKAHTYKFQGGCIANVRTERIRKRSRPRYTSTTLAS
jgi:hypothetical protein